LAGYSGTPLVRKLGIKDAHRVACLNSPEGFADLLGQLPVGVTLCKQIEAGPFDVILLFVRSEDQLRDEFDELRASLSPAGGLWVCWPKKASGIKTDLTEDVIRGFGLAAGLVDNKVCAVDDTWSGLRLVIRLRDRGRKPRDLR
jgi:hypothetical protein